MALLKKVRHVDSAGYCVKFYKKCRMFYVQYLVIKALIQNTNFKHNNVLHMFKTHYMKIDYEK